MKRLFLLLAVVALGLASCTEENFDNYNNSDSNQIGFNTMVGKNSLHKAYEITGTQFTKFGVYAYHTADKEIDALSAGHITSYFANLIVNRNNAAVGAAWTNEQDHYWPNNDILQFFAYAGDEVDWKTSLTPNVGPTFEYTVNAVRKDQKDIIIASAFNRSKADRDGNGGGASTDLVKLQFKHILTQVNFSIQGKEDGYKYNLEEIKVTGVNNKGTFTYDITAENAGAWNLTGAKTDELIYYSTTATDYNDAAITAIGKSPVVEVGEGSNVTDSRAFMLLPIGTDAAAVKVYVKYNVTNELGDTEVTPSDTYEVELTGSPDWNQATKIRYTLTLPVSKDDSDKITFTADVDDWATDDTDGGTHELE